MKFQENTPEEERTPTMRENTYIRVTGNVRAFNDKKNLVAFRIMPVTDPNEITTHMLEVIQAHVALTKAVNNVSLDVLPYLFIPRFRCLDYQERCYI